MELLYLFIKSFVSGLHCGCMFLKKDFLYAGKSEKFKPGYISITVERNFNQLQALLVYDLCI